ncbi:hypothetical protein CC86DRAFT_410890 [Ophiobolus disseminans]|uniref:Uncharacterized protein n=1 Tax=Ophiobolus disseminans TaxID=1469910 RepID=A0A6A6ZL35_9PLEO|nr:hypothetical protein CC86DRAFT_410890 [Ophiobolus disseminans]
MATFHNFLDLPAELREYVYAHYIDLEFSYGTSFMKGQYAQTKNWPDLHINNETCSLDQQPTLARFLPIVAFTNQQVRSEVVRVLLHRTQKVALTDPARVVYFTKFLGTFNGFCLITNLSFLEYGTEEDFATHNIRFPNDNVALSLIKRCENIHTLEIAFRASFRAVEKFNLAECWTASLCGSFVLSGAHLDLVPPVWTMCWA